MTEKTINDIPISVILGYIERLEQDAEAHYYLDFDDLLQEVPIFIRKPI